MEKLSMCRICLAENVKMYAVTKNNLLEIYEKVTNYPFVTEDCRPVQACFFCYAKLKQCCQFVRKCLKAEEEFTQMLNVDYERKLSKVQDLEFYGGYIKTTIQHLEIIDECHDVCDNIKVEVPAECDNRPVELKQEPQSDDQGPQNPEGTYVELEEVSLQQFGSDSEDDVPLKEFQNNTDEEQATKKATKVKKKVKKSPVSDCLEIYLTKEQQLEDLLARSKSLNYTNSPYKCGLCYKGFVDATAFSKHELKHNESSGSYVCDICHMRYRTEQLMRTHAKNTHTRLYKCNKCGFNAHTANQARIHEKWHNGHIYECLLCGHTFRKPTSYLSHIRQRHPTEHVCNICGGSFVGKHGLQMHKTKTHINEKMLDPDDPQDPAADRFCSECNIQFYTLEAWKRHILNSIKHTLQTKDGNQCAICSWQYSGNITLATHMKEHEKSLRTSKNSTIDKARSEGNMRCQQCGLSYPTSSKLLAHINRTHLGIKYYKNIVCEVCGRKCTSNAKLKYHQRIHTGEKPYGCSSCSKHFANSNQLRIHTRIHTGERPYVCAACGKRFTQKPALTRHYRIHTGAKPYTCHYCSRTFTQSNSLKLHVNTVHLKQPTKPRLRKTKNAAQLKIEMKNEDLQAIIVKAFNN